MTKPSVKQQNMAKKECLDVYSLFEGWRAAGRPYNGWGLAWFLAFQFCRRFYASHGIAPLVIAHEGLGYYGIGLEYVSCRVNRAEEPLSVLGRLAMEGDVENWRTGANHRLKTSELCWKGMPTEKLISLAIDHMRLLVYPSKSHVNCRHKRWGASFELVFGGSSARLATLHSLVCQMYFVISASIIASKKYAIISMSLRFNSGNLVPGLKGSTCRVACFARNAYLAEGAAGGTFYATFFGETD